MRYVLIFLALFFTLLGLLAFVHTLIMNYDFGLPMTMLGMAFLSLGITSLIRLWHLGYFQK